MKAKLKLASFALLASVMVFTGCGSPGTNSNTSNAGQPSQGAAEKTESKQVTQLTFSEPVRVLSFAPLYVAIEKGYLKEEGFDAKIVSGGGGAQVSATLISGQAQFGVAAPQAALKSMGVGKETTVIQSINSSLTYDIVLSNKYLEKKGLDPTKPLSLKEKVEALKGATMATDNIGDSGDVFMRYLMELYGQNPDDLKVVKLAGRGPKIGAMKEGVIDGGINSAPFSLEASDKNVGAQWIKTMDVPEYSNMTWELIFTMKDYAEKNEDQIVKVVRAIGKGIEFTRENPEEAASLIAKKYFDGTDEKLIQEGLKQLNGTFVGHGEMTQEAWENAVKPMVEYSDLTGLPKEVDTTPGKFWTNKYIEEAFKN
ncbi:ABC transporter substrate-binding protein [Brevibacillus sp. B_LB10_24]